MSEFVEKYNDHNVHQLLSGLISLVQDTSWENFNHEAISLLDRILNALRYVENHLAAAIPDLAQQDALDKLSNALQALKNELDQFFGNKNAAHLNNAGNQISVLVNQVSRLPLPLHKKDNESISTETLRYKKFIDELLREYKEQAKKYQDNLQALKSEIVSLRKEVKEQNDIIEQNKARQDAIINDFQQQFSNAEQARREEFNDTLNKVRNDNSELYDDTKKEKEEIIKTTRAEIDKQIDDSNQKIGKILQTLEEKKNEASKLVQVIGNIGVTGNYQRIANQEAATANLYRRIAMALMIAMVAIIGLTVFLSLGPNLDWKVLIFRVGAAVILAFPAIYAARESAKHRAVERKNRQAELELASIDLYLEKMPDETKNELKGRLTEKFFGNIHDDNKNNDTITSMQLYDLVKLALQNLTKQ